MFATDAGITSATINDADIDLIFSETSTGLSLPMFASAKIMSMSGKVSVPVAASWNAPAVFNGSLVAGLQATPPALGPVDILPGAAFAVSCARQLSASYSGPLCRVQRASDSTQMDLYANGFGNLDKTAYNSFCNGTTCAWETWYDQSGNTNNYVQTTAASQPPASLSVAGLGGKPAGLWGDQSAYALVAPAATSINNIFAAGGYLSAVMNMTTNANAADRIWFKSAGGPSGGSDIRVEYVGTGMLFQQYGSTGNGFWEQTTAIYTAPFSLLADFQYSTSSIANVATLGLNGTTLATTNQQPTGTLNPDTSYSAIIGNNATSAGTRGFPGYIAEVVAWKTTPTALQLEAIRRNQAAYYGLGATVN
jgi:hypothetical protein